MKVNWGELKSFVDDRKLSIQYVDVEGKYFLHAIDGPFSLTCELYKDPSDTTDILDFENNYKPLGNKPIITDVVGPFEKADKDLVLASDDQPFIGNICTLQLLVPGTLGEVGARQIAGGYGFTDVYCWGDRITKVELLDKDYAYAGILYPAEPAPGVTWPQAEPNGVVMGSYVDDELPEINRGWRLWCDDGNQGGVDIDPIGGFGKLLALCYLTITVEKKPASNATRACLNSWWGRPNA